MQQSAEAAGRDMCCIINSLLPTLISLASSIETNRFSHKLLIRQALILEEKFIAIFVKLATTSGRLVLFSLIGSQGLQSGITTWGTGCRVADRHLTRITVAFKGCRVTA